MLCLDRSIFHIFTLGTTTTEVRKILNFFMHSSIGIHRTLGRKNYQHDRYLVYNDEDVSIYGVADGHGHSDSGHLVSEYACDNLVSELKSNNVIPSKPTEPTVMNVEDMRQKIIQTIDTLDKKAIEMTSSRKLYAGSTLNAVIWFKKLGELLDINVGDSRAILVSVTSDSNELRVKQLSKDHDCTDEVEHRRITDAGGVVIGGTLNGYITMSRSLGNNELKEHRNRTQFPFPGKGHFSSNLFINTPDVEHHTVSSEEDVYIVIASDGVWKRLSNEQVAKLINKDLSAGEKSIEQIAADVCSKAMSKGSKDNSTCLIVPLTDLETVRQMIKNSLLTTSLQQSLSNFTFSGSLLSFNSISTSPRYNSTLGSPTTLDGGRFEKRSISNFISVSRTTRLDDNENLLAMEEVVVKSSTEFQHDSHSTASLSEEPSSPTSVMNELSVEKHTALPSSKVARHTAKKESWFRRKLRKRTTASASQSS